MSTKGRGTEDDDGPAAARLSGTAARAVPTGQRVEGVRPRTDDRDDADEGGGHDPVRARVEARDIDLDVAIDDDVTTGDTTAGFASPRLGASGLRSDVGDLFTSVTDDAPDVPQGRDLISAGSGGTETGGGFGYGVVLRDGEVAGGGSSSGRDSLPGFAQDIVQRASDAASGSTQRAEEAAREDAPLGPGPGGGDGTGSGDTGSGGSTTAGDDGTDSLVQHEIANDDGSTTTVYEDGTFVTAYPDGTTEVNHPDGTVETTYPDGTHVEEYVDGSTSTVHPDGTITETPPPDDTGSDEPPDDTGSDDTGSDDSGSDDTGSDGEPPDDDGAEAGGGVGSTPVDDAPPPPVDNPLLPDLDHTIDLPAAAEGGDVDPADDNFEFGLGAVGPVEDLQGTLLTGPGGDSRLDDLGGFGSGRPIGDLGDDGVTDPSPFDDGVPQGTGPEERDTGHEFEAPVDDGAGDTADDGFDEPVIEVAPFHPVFDAGPDLPDAVDLDD